MRLTLAAAMLAASLLPAAAAERMVHCRIAVAGHTYLDGPCMFAPQPDGSFTLGGGTETVRPSPYFAFVSKNEDGSAEASWNETAGSLHAQTGLGTVRRRGACWINAKAKICAD